MLPRTLIEELFGLVFELLFQLVIGPLLELLGVILQGIAKVLGLTIEAPTRGGGTRGALKTAAFALFGAGIGALSLWAFPRIFLEASWLRWANMIASPVAGGLLMIGMEHLLRPGRPGPAASTSDRLKAQNAGKLRGLTSEIRALPRPSDVELFFRGFSFCLAFSIVRFVWGR